MNYLFSYLISFSLGYLVLGLMSRQYKETFPRGLFLTLAFGLGIGLSAHITFYSLVLFDRLETTFILTAHLALLFIFAFFYRPRFKKFSLPRLKGHKVNPWQAASFVFIIFLIALWWMQARFYPFGGWDAWSAWNLKAKFLFLGDKNWKALLDPILWRSSPHYPLLLPLLNAWGWIFGKNPVNAVPLFNSLLFSSLTAGLLFFGLKTFRKDWIPALAPLLLFTLAFFATLATSQYSDIVVGLYLLGALICLFMAKRNKSKTMMALAGFYLGFLSFAKSEGTVAAILIFILALVYLRVSIPFFLTAALASLPLFIFTVFYAPQNQTFINGLASAEHPATLARIKFILSFLAVELVSGKWNGAWVLLLGGALLNIKNSFKKNYAIFPLFLFLYLATVVAYYYVNTYFELGWWLSVSLNRILFSLLPLTAFWTFASFGETNRA